MSRTGVFWVLASFLFLGSVEASRVIEGERRFSQEEHWALPSYIDLAKNQPEKLIQLAREQFSVEALNQAKSDRGLTHAWQDRTALLGGLSLLFDPEISQAWIQKRKERGQEGLPQLRKEARELIAQAMKHDTALLVRDSAVETVRRILRMQPEDASAWKAHLESSFLDRKNILNGEGLFIRETLLNALREANLPLSARVRRSAELDQNAKVKNLLGLWRTRMFDKL